MNNKKKKPKATATNEQPTNQVRPMTQRQLADLYTLQQMQEEGEAYQAAYDMAGMNLVPVAPLTQEQLALRDKLNTYYDAKQKDPTLRPKFGPGGEIGNGLGSVLTGLLTDSGPITSGVGSFINFVTGSLDQQKQEAAERKMRSQSLNAMYYSTPAATNTLGLTATYPMGGQIAAPNAELEKQEGFRMPNPTGQPIVGNVNGPAHSQGGVPVTLPNGTQIYSDRIKHVNEFGKKETFADTEKRYKRQLARYQKDTSDAIGKRTNQIMSERIQNKLQALFDEQEALKASQGITQPVEQYANGGRTGDPPIGRYIYKQPEWESRLYNQSSVVPIVNPDGSSSTHKMMSYETDGINKAAPTIINQNGRLVELSPRDAMRYAETNKTYKEFHTEEDAQRYAEGEYKKGTKLQGYALGGTYTGRNNLNVTPSTQYPNGGIYSNPVYFNNFANAMSAYGPYGQYDEQLMWDDMAMVSNDFKKLQQQSAATPTQNPGYQQQNPGTSAPAMQMPTGLAQGNYGQLPANDRKLSPGLTQLVGSSLNLNPGSSAMNPVSQNILSGFNLNPTYNNQTPPTVNGYTPSIYNTSDSRNRSMFNTREQALSAGIQAPDPNDIKMNMFQPKENLLYSKQTQQFVDNMKNGTYNTSATSAEDETDDKNPNKKEIIAGMVKNALNSAVELAPQIYNLFQKRPEEKNIDRFMNTDAIKAERMNVTQQVRDLERTYAAVINDQSLSPAERLMASRQLQSEKNKLYQGVDNQYITDINQAKQMNTAIKQQNIQTAMTLEDQYAADTAAYMNMKAQAAGDISQYAQKKKLEGNINTQNEQLQNALKSAFPTYSFNADGSITNKETGEPLSAEEIKRVEDYFTGLTTLNRTTLKQDPYWSNTGYGNQSAYSYAYGQAIHPSN